MKLPATVFLLRKINPFLLLIAIAILFTHRASGQAGSLDISFGNNGRVVLPSILGSSLITASALQNDGRIVVTGQVIIGSSIDFITARFLSDGAPDSSFNGTGYKITNLSSPPNNYANTAYATAIQADGKIIVAGNNYNGINTDIALVRFNSDGTIDSTFNITGIVYIDNGGSETARGMLLQPDGKIVVAGGTSIPNGNFFISRLNTDGTPDITFGTNGNVTTDINASAQDEILAIAIQQDGKLAVTGVTQSVPVVRQLALARYNTDGSADTTFSGDGQLVVNYTGKDVFSCITINPSGKLIVGGSVYDYGSFCVAQFNSDGTPDATFGVNGKTITSLNSTDVHAKGVALQQDGKILLGGGRYDFTNDQNFVVVRYTTSGIEDNGFDFDGIAETDFAGFADDIFSVIIQPDGKIIGSGYSSLGTATKISLARYNSDCLASIASQNIEICNGESYTVGNNTYTVAGVYVDTLISASGCDSLLTTNLNVLPVSLHSQNIDIQQGDSVVIGNNVYYTSGTYLDTLVAANGCDSLLYTTVTVITGINAPGSGAALLIAGPNPANDYIQLSGTVSGYNISVIDQNGKTIFDIKSDAEITMVPLHTITSGVYYLLYRTDRETKRIKIVRP